MSLNLQGFFFPFGKVYFEHHISMENIIVH